MLSAFNAHSWRVILCQVPWHLGFVVPRLGWMALAVIFHFLSGLWSGQQAVVVSVVSNLPTPNVGDGFFLASSGPPLGHSNLFSLLVWLLSTTFYLLLIGDLANSQIGKRDYLIVLRLRSRSGWWFGILLTIVATAIGYVVIVVAATLAGTASQLQWHPYLSRFFAEQAIWQAASGMSLVHLIVIVFLLTASSLAVAGLTQTVVALYTRRTIWGTLSVLTLALLVWLGGLGDNNNWLQWLPGYQSILSRHWPFEPRLPSVTFGASIAYNLVLAAWWTILGGWLLRAFDVLGSRDDD
jgi:hypothetical protein